MRVAAATDDMIEKGKLTLGAACGHGRWTHVRPLEWLTALSALGEGHGCRGPVDAQGGRQITMPTGSPLVLGALLCALVSFTLPTAVASAGEVGISDQRAGTFADARLTGLEIRHARVVVPWDVASDPAAAEALTRWLDAAGAAGMRPLVAFERAAGERCPDAPCHRPAPGELGAAVRAFHARWPDVRELTAWNEPNHPSQPTAKAPEAAAALHDAVRAACPVCTVVAGDVVDSATMRSWLRRYRAALTLTPQVWGIHNYGDATYDRPSYTAWLLAEVPEPVWVTETGGIVSLWSDDVMRLPYDEARAAASLGKALDLSATHAGRIARTYVYQWQSAPWDPFDAGLLTWFGEARPGLAVLRDRVGLRPGADPAVWARTPSATTPARGGPRTAEPARSDPEAAWRIKAEVARSRGLRGDRPRRVRGGYRLMVRCAPRRASPCRGRIRLRATRRGRAVALGTAPVRIAPGALRPVRIRVGPVRAQRAARLGHHTLETTITTNDPPARLVQRWTRRTTA